MAHQANSHLPKASPYLDDVESGQPLFGEQQRHQIGIDMVEQHDVESPFLASDNNNPSSRSAKGRFIRALYWIIPILIGIVVAIGFGLCFAVGFDRTNVVPSHDTHPGLNSVHDLHSGPRLGVYSGLNPRSDLNVHDPHSSLSDLNAHSDLNVRPDTHHSPSSDLNPHPDSSSSSPTGHADFIHPADASPSSTHLDPVPLKSIDGPVDGDAAFATADKFHSGANKVRRNIDNKYAPYNRKHGNNENDGAGDKTTCPELSDWPELNHYNDMRVKLFNTDSEMQDLKDPKGKKWAVVDNLIINFLSDNRDIEDPDWLDGEMDFSPISPRCTILLYQLAGPPGFNVLPALRVNPDDLVGRVKQLEKDGKIEWWGTGNAEKCPDNDESLDEDVFLPLEIDDPQTQLLADYVNNFGENLEDDVEAVNEEGSSVADESFTEFNFEKYLEDGFGFDGGIGKDRIIKYDNVRFLISWSDAFGRPSFSIQKMDKTKYQAGKYVPRTHTHFNFFPTTHPQDPGLKKRVDSFRAFGGDRGHFVAFGDYSRTNSLAEGETTNRYENVAFQYGAVNKGPVLYTESLYRCTVDKEPYETTLILTGFVPFGEKTEEMGAFEEKLFNNHGIELAYGFYKVMINLPNDGRSPPKVTTIFMRNKKDQHIYLTSENIITLDRLETMIGYHPLKDILPNLSEPVEVTWGDLEKSRCFKAVKGHVDRVIQMNLSPENVRKFVSKKMDLLGFELASDYELKCKQCNHVVKFHDIHRFSKAEIHHKSHNTMGANALASLRIEMLKDINTKKVNGGYYECQTCKQKTSAFETARTHALIHMERTGTWMEKARKEASGYGFIIDDDEGVVKCNIVDPTVPGHPYSLSLSLEGASLYRRMTGHSLVHTQNRKHLRTSAQIATQTGFVAQEKDGVNGFQCQNNVATGAQCLFWIRKGNNDVRTRDSHSKVHLERFDPVHFYYSHVEMVSGKGVHYWNCSRTDGSFNDKGETIQRVNGMCGHSVTARTEVPTLQAHIAEHERRVAANNSP